MASETPDRSAFVEWCRDKFAAVPTMPELFELIDQIRDRRAMVRQEGNRAAEAELTAIVSAAYQRLGGKK